MSGPIEVTCSHCEGAGDVIFYIFRGQAHHVHCQWCHGTGWVPVTTLPGWAQARAEAIRADQLRRHEAGLDADLAYQTGGAAGEVEQ